MRQPKFWGVGLPAYSLFSGVYNLSKQQSFTDQLWDFFCSLKLAIFTLILLALTSIIGTVIQQNKSPQEYMEMYGMSESTFKLLDSLQFFDMYHSYWFLSLLGIFAVNLICCSIKPVSWATTSGWSVATLFSSAGSWDRSWHR